MKRLFSSCRLGKLKALATSCAVAMAAALPCGAVVSAADKSVPKKKPDAAQWHDQGAEDDAEAADVGAPQARFEARTYKDTDGSEAADEAEHLTASSHKVRRFHEVLDELLAEFAYDVKGGQIKGLANLSIRKVRVSKAIPTTYEDYVETLLIERIRDNSQVKILVCIPCKARTSSLVDGKLLVTSPATNLTRLEAAAGQIGIENFMDAVLVYHTTHMVLALSVFDAKSQELVWARTYNSETVKSRYQKLAVDYSQVAKARTSEEYVPEYRFLFGAGGASIPNVGGSGDDRQMLDLQVRATEKFDNRRSEFGLLLSIFKSSSATLNSYPTQGGTGQGATSGADTTTTADAAAAKAKPAPFRTAVAIYGVYGHQFLGAIESYNTVRQGLHFGLGGIAATGYLAPLARVGWDIYLGRRFATSFAANYIAPSSIVIGTEIVKTKGGSGGDVVLSLNY